MVVDVLDVGIVSLHWRLRVLAWGRRASYVCARGQRDVASGWRRSGGGGGGRVPSVEGLWVFGPRG